ncbi:MAG TPA: ABC transporter ATP-binding protein [Thermodesulfobacteriota bacterium]|jgi:branched-chain amino acid transport system ATP-binding protein|nr:ABC transporter ATP-binding protein [Thermodesulfobacteriota bacterium]
MLEVRKLNSFYGAVQALKNVSISVKKGDIITIIGANGAGKTTLLKTISGLIRDHKGNILYEEKSLSGLLPGEIVALGICLVPEGRQLFGHLSVLDNLKLGAYLYFDRRHKDEIGENMEKVYAIFPILKNRRRQLSGTLSGGEQQMLAIGRAMMSRPKLMMMDEPSMGLAPLMVREIFRVIRELHHAGTTILLVEQNARAALKMGVFGYVLETGEIVLQGDTNILLEDEKVKHAYLGK